MIKRIVKLSFRPDQCDQFLQVFENSKQQIRASEGCYHLELWRAKDEAGVFFTYSFWEDQAALDAYRHSELFKTTWKQTKALFANKAKAWSVDMVDLVRV